MNTNKQLTKGNKMKKTIAIRQEEEKTTIVQILGGLMIGFEMEAGLEELRKVLLNDLKIFTGAAKPNVIRLLPSLAISMEDINLFLTGLNNAIQVLKQNKD